MITLEVVPFEDPEAQALWRAQQSELLARYGDEDVDAVLVDEGTIVSLIGRSDGAPVASGMIRWSPYETPPGTAEAKRIYVVPEHRGHGHSRVIMGALEAHARRAGATRIYVETGVKQPEAIGLYEAIGYSRITPYGAYADHPDSVCLGLELPTRVIVVDAAHAADAQRMAEGLWAELSRRGVRVALVDAVPFDEEADFAAAASGTRDGEAGVVIVARPLDDPAEAAGIGTYFRGDGGAEVTTLRVVEPGAGPDESGDDVVAELGDHVSESAKNAVAALGW